jgi:hypothetical protein
MWINRINEYGLVKTSMVIVKNRNKNDRVTTYTNLRNFLKIPQ